MRAFACPYSYNYCGASSSEIVMHPTRRNNIAVEISNRLFIDSETCYYTFSVPTSDLDTEKMRYFWDVEISKNTNVDIIINNGTSYETGGDSIQVSFSTGYKFQYFAENNNIYVSFTANVPSTSTTQPVFAITVKLRSFEINPELPEPTPLPTPEPTPEPQPVEPVEPDPQPEPIDPTPEVKPKEPEKEIAPEGDDSDLNEPEVITVYETEYITVKKPVVVTEQSKDKPRKKQVGLTVLTGGTALAILVYFLIEFIQKRLAKRHERKQVKVTAMASAEAIEIVPNSASNSNINLMRIPSFESQSEKHVHPATSEQHGLID